MVLLMMMTMMLLTCADEHQIHTLTGELFDHGLDSSTASLQAIAIFPAFGLCICVYVCICASVRDRLPLAPKLMSAGGLAVASADVFFWITAGVLISFICSHVEKFSTGLP
jgi:hypothetical protein